MDDRPEGREMGTWASPLEELEHERLEIVRDDAHGLLAVIAVHSTALGPAMGGVRRTAYPSLDDAVADALRLSKAMTLKNAAAGLPLGGGKSVVVDDGPAFAPAALDAFAAAVDDLGGRYVAAEDIGTTPADMDRMAATTRWVAGCSVDRGGSGDPSPSTATTVLGAIEHALRVRHGSPELAGRRIGVLGCGKVGGRLVELLAERGADVLAADVDAARTAAAAGRPGVRAGAVAEILETPLDVLVPCARGGVITHESVAGVRAQIVCGAANNILADDDVAAELHAAGVLYVPDFVANAGGIVQVGGEYLGWSAEQIADRVQAAIDRAGAVLDEAEAAGVPPLNVALRRAAERLTGERTAA